MMKTATRKLERQFNPQPITPATVRDRVAHISSAWTPEERQLRAVEGQLRRELLLAMLGLDERKACA